MKYISTLIFTLALTYTWGLVHRENPINFETHASLQLKMVEVIRQSVSELKPTAQDIKVLNISTESVNDHTIKAIFTYQFLEPDTETGELTEQQIEGEAQLRRNQNSDSTEDHWVMDNVKTKSGTLNFKNGIIISPLSVPGTEPTPGESHSSPIELNDSHE